MTETSPHESEPRAAVGCAHCGLPAPAPAGTAPAFCCAGCRVVYEALREADMDETFYRLRDASGGAAQARAPEDAAGALALAELDTPAFLEEHTTAAPEGARTAELFLDGVHCAACVWLVERLPQEVEGVLEATLDLPRARLSLRWEPGVVSLSAVARWLARFGYAARPVRGQDSSRRTEAERKLLVKVGVCWALAGNVMLLAFAFYAGLDLTTDPMLATAGRYASLALALPSLLYGGSEFFRRAWASLAMSVEQRSWRHLHMDTPIALGLLVGFADSAWSTVQGSGEVWFDSLTVLVAALLTARWLQLRSRRLAGDATERLLGLVPSMARRLGTDGLEEAVPTAVVQPGDRVRVLAGEVFPVDGTVEAGASTVDRAVLTGESRPEAVAAGDAVAAGTTNLRAPVTVRADASGEETRVGQLVGWVRSRAQAQSPVVLLADRMAGYFVLVVLALAVVTAGLWLWMDPSRAMQHVVALLVISCPCALGMATPLAMAVATGRAARAGIFVKSDRAFQRLTEVDALVLDKTGTLTHGAMTLVTVDGSERAVRLASALEEASTHPVAVALTEAYPPASATAEDVDVVAGAGVRGRVGGHDVVAGRPDWVCEQARADAAHRARLSRYAADGHTPVAIAVDGCVRATLAFGDRLRDEAPHVVERLRARGTTVYLLSGDHPDVAQAVARSLRIAAQDARGGVGPEDKKAFVEALQGEGRVVAMVGDGVNDMAALQAADVGVAVGGGSPASHVAADVFLTRAGLAPLLDLLDGAGRVLRVIRRNLGVSLAYNLVGATAAMAGLVSPLVAAVAMPLSSLVVVTSSIAQRSFDPAASSPSVDPARRPAPARDTAHSEPDRPEPTRAEPALSATA